MSSLEDQALSLQERAHRAVEQGIDQAIAEGREKGFSTGQIVAHRGEEYALKFLSSDGDVAVLEAHPNAVKPGESLIKRLPLAEIYDLRRCYEIAGELAVNEARRDRLASGGLFGGTGEPIESC